jgi:hypothetical protein
MNPIEAPPVELHEGVNDPSPFARVLVLDWYDGPTGGVLQVGDAGAIYRFLMLDERQRGDDADVRVYGLYPMSDGALNRLIDLLSPYMAARWPVWCPVWRFPTDEVRRAVDGRTTEILNGTGPLAWVVVGDLGTGPIRALPVRAAKAS